MQCTAHVQCSCLMPLLKHNQKKSYKSSLGIREKTPFICLGGVAKKWFDGGRATSRLVIVHMQFDGSISEFEFGSYAIDSKMRSFSLQYCRYNVFIRFFFCVTFTLCKHFVFSFSLCLHFIQEYTIYIITEYIWWNIHLICLIDCRYSHVQINSCQLVISISFQSKLNIIIS